MWNPFKRTEKIEPSLLNDDLYNALFADDPDDFITLKDHPALSWIYEYRTPTLEELELLAEDQVGRVKKSDSLPSTPRCNAGLR